MTKSSEKRRGQTQAAYIRHGDGEATAENVLGQLIQRYYKSLKLFTQKKEPEGSLGLDAIIQ